MNSLLVKILTAMVTFVIGVAIANVWLTRWVEPVIKPVTVSTPAAFCLCQCPARASSATSQPRPPNTSRRRAQDTERSF